MADFGKLTTTFSTAGTKPLGTAVEELLKNNYYPSSTRYTPKQLNVDDYGLADALRNAALSPQPRFVPVGNDMFGTTKEEVIPKQSRFYSGPAQLTDDQFNKLIEIESGGNYEAYNERSGAYGKYQFIPSTAAAYAKKLGFVGNEWKKPENQEAMFRAFTQDNIDMLNKKGIPVDAFHVYAAHQQGVGGLSNILAGNMTPSLERNLRSNLPGASSSLKGLALRDAWVNHWKNRLNT